MTAKEPVLLTVLIETAKLRWYVGGIGLDGAATPLVCSEPGNLKPYVGVAFDEQVNFLRHRLCGVLQRGCDRLWGRKQKPCQVVFVADGPFVEAEPELTDRVAEHFVAWMANPPVVYFVIRGGTMSAPPSQLDAVAGSLAAEWRPALETGLSHLCVARELLDAWELVPTKKTPA
jgi:hypothetical protein